MMTAVLTQHLSWVTKYAREKSKHLHSENTQSHLLAKHLCSIHGAGYWPIHSSNPFPQKPTNINSNSPLSTPHHNHSQQVTSSSPISSDGQSTTTNTLQEIPFIIKKFSRVIVVGSDPAIMRNLLYVISFLMRSEELIEKEYSIIDHQFGSTPITNHLLPDTPVTAPPCNGNSYTNEMFEHVISTMSSDSNLSNGGGSISDMTNSAAMSSLNLGGEEDVTNGSGRRLQRSNTMTDISIPELPRSETFDSKITLCPFQFIEINPHHISTCSSNHNLHITINHGNKTLQQEETNDNVTTAPPPTFINMNQEHAHKHAIKNQYNKFGHALYGDICTWYCGAMVLMALPKSIDFMEQAVSDLKYLQSEIMDGDDRAPQITSLVIVDSDDLLCNVVTCKNSKKQNGGISFQESKSSRFVKETLDTMRSMSSIGLDDEACDVYFDDQLRLLYSKAVAVVELVDALTRDSIKHHLYPHKFENVSDGDFLLLEHHHSSMSSMSMSSFLQQSSMICDVPKLTFKQVASSVQMAVSDIPLLLSIVSTFRADVIERIIKNSNS
ncbi:FNIP1 [Acrasis kona]|uniref:FNIP1 n=1 Tax=Acrasis kona TaxID=1008807 RepID=A0AAW2ZDQ7_9EUKA